MCIIARREYRVSDGGTEDSEDFIQRCPQVVGSDVCHNAERRVVETFLSRDLWERKASFSAVKDWPDKSLLPDSAPTLAYFKREILAAIKTNAAIPGHSREAEDATAEETLNGLDSARNGVFHPLPKPIRESQAQAQEQASLRMVSSNNRQGETILNRIEGAAGAARRTWDNIWKRNPPKPIQEDSSGQFADVYTKYIIDACMNDTILDLGVSATLANIARELKEATDKVTFFNELNPVTQNALIEAIRTGAPFADQDLWLQPQYAQRTVPSNDQQLESGLDHTEDVASTRADLPSRDHVFLVDDPSSMDKPAVQAAVFGTLHHAAQLTEERKEFEFRNDNHEHERAPMHKPTNEQSQRRVYELEHVMRTQEKLAEDHPDRLKAQRDLAVAYLARGQTVQAIELLEHVVRIQEMLPEDHPARLMAQHDLAHAYLAGGQMAQAVELLEHVVRTQERHLAEDDPVRLMAQHDLAHAYLVGGRIVSAIELLDHILRLQENRAEDNPVRLTAQHELAKAYLTSGRFQEATDLLERVVEIEKRSLREDLPRGLAAQISLANAYLSQDRTAEAVGVLEHVVSVRDRALADDHPDRLALQRLLAQAQARRRHGQMKNVRAYVDEPLTSPANAQVEHDYPRRGSGPSQARQQLNGTTIPTTSSQDVSPGCPEVLEGVVARSAYTEAIDATMLPQFRYEPLQYDSKQVRLLKLVAGSGCPFEINLATHSVGNLPRYSAVSYLWGSGPRTTPLCINGAWTVVHRSTYDALLRCWECDVGISIYLDGVSINEADSTETGAQMALMETIYRQAESVIIYLGSDNTPSSNSEHSLVNEMRTTGRIGGLQIFTVATVEMMKWEAPVPDSALQAKQAFNDIVSRPYWTRTWVMQEIMLARRVQLLYHTAPGPQGFGSHQQIAWKSNATQLLSLPLQSAQLCPDVQLAWKLPLAFSKDQGVISTSQTPAEVDCEPRLGGLTDEASDASSTVSASNLSSVRESSLRHGSSSVDTMPTTIESRHATGRDDTTSAAGQPGNDEDDLCSIRTDAQDIGAGIGQDQRKELAGRFATELLDSLASEDLTEDVLAAMPELLLDFSKVLAHKATGDVQRTATTFVRHHRRNIVRCAQERLDMGTKILPPGMEKTDITSWVARISGDGTEAAEVPLDVVDLPELDALEHHDDDLPANIGQAREFLLMGTEFQWLLNRIKTTSSTMETGPERLELHKYMVDLPSGRNCNLKAEIEWNPLYFLQQQYQEVPGATIGTSITYNGADELVEAVGCKDFISRARMCLGGQHTIIKLSIRHGILKVAITGDPLASVEAIEVLAWLGAACRASPKHARPMYCSPRLTIASTAARLRIDFIFSDLHPASENGDMLPEALAAQIPEKALCWMQLVNNPVVVKGYPVSRRYDDEKGLEIEVGLMTALSRASRATVFDGVMVIQGLYSMLVAVAETTGSIMWHYLLGQDRGRVCYSEALRYCEKPTTTSFTGLQHARHFVGWTKYANILTGTKDARYEVGFAGRLTEAGCVLENVTIGVSKILAFSAKLSIGSKDMRHASPISEDYKQRILQLEVVRVVFYDTSGKRAWMVNGADALLHITRAYLTSPHAPPARHHISERLAAQFVHREVSTERPQKAYDVLCDPNNLKIRICPEREAVANGEVPRHVEHSEDPAGTCLEDLVAHFAELLWDMLGHQHKVQAAQKGSVAVPKWPFKAKLEGFGFADVVSLQPLLQPRFAELSFFGPSWLKATDLAGTINIIGSGFGELIMSRDECQSCTGVPPGRDFLATSTEILRQIAEYTGGDCQNHLQLGRGIFWNKPNDAYANAESIRCRCDSSSHGIRCGVKVTHLMSSSAPLPHAWEPDDEEARFVNNHPHAAVIIGDRESWREARRAIYAADRACIGCRLRAKKNAQIAALESSIYEYPTPQSSAGAPAEASVDSGYGTADPSQAGSTSLHEEGLVVDISHDGPSRLMPNTAPESLESCTRNNLAKASARLNPREDVSESWTGSTGSSERAEQIQRPLNTSRVYSESAQAQVVQSGGPYDQIESMAVVTAAFREHGNSNTSPGSIECRALESPRRLRRSTRSVADCR
ncbi:hypothetical protein LTR27_007757 [Elasticomyces elasticus]|nr:hypothetical protein LTR27_007757 [Elasticomyces elasticus]